MKKISTLLVFLAVAMLPLAFSSCEDQDIGMTLEGTWEGNTYVYSEWGDEMYASTRTQLYFEADVFKFKEGGGYWIDYYNEHPWDSHRNYVASKIHWRVVNKVIYIHFREDNYDIEIRDYRLNDNRFEGTIYDGDRNIDFYLVHTSSPNWDRYDYYGYDHYYDYYGVGAKASIDGDAKQGEPVHMKRVFIPNK